MNLWFLSLILMGMYIVPMKTYNLQESYAVGVGAGYEEGFQLEENLEKRKPEKRLDKVEFIQQLQRFFLNTTSNSSTPKWTVKDFEKQGFKMSLLVAKLNNKLLMNQLAQLFSRYGLVQFLKQESGPDGNVTLTVDLEAIVKGLDVVLALDLMIELRIVPPMNKNRRPNIRHHDKRGSNEGGRGGEGDGGGKRDKQRGGGNKNNQGGRGGRDSDEGGRGGGGGGGKNKKNNNNKGGRGGGNGSHERNYQKLVQLLKQVSKNRELESVESVESVESSQESFEN